ncbi:hypothetical protein Q667_08870 [Marinobacter sp. C1S70]|nr:hypothetical protein Q667_08870 [Marinobacter sp. C1S70]
MVPGDRTGIALTVRFLRFVVLGVGVAGRKIEPVGVIQTPEVSGASAEHVFSGSVVRCVTLASVLVHFPKVVVHFPVKLVGELAIALEVHFREALAVKAIVLPPGIPQSAQEISVAASGICLVTGGKVGTGLEIAVFIRICFAGIVGEAAVQPERDLTLRKHGERAGTSQ